jgi:hypothetical protein
MTITSRQIALEYSDIRGFYKFKDENAVEDFAAMKEDIFNLIELMNDNSKPLFGVGSPEGSVAANNSLIYFDTTNEPANITMWANKIVGGKTGWLQIV